MFFYSLFVIVLLAIDLFMLTINSSINLIDEIDI